MKQPFSHLYLKHFLKGMKGSSGSGIYAAKEARNPHTPFYPSVRL
jgi:hypothetical protein